MTPKGPSDHIWHTAIGRSQFSFRSNLYSDDAPFFLSVDHLEAIVKQRQRMRRLGTLLFFVAIAISFVILLKSSDLALDIQTPAGTIRNLPISTNVLLFGLLVATGYYVIALLNHTLLSKQIHAIFEHAGLEGSDAVSRAAHASARWSADDLCIDLFTVHPFGFRSGLAHALLVITALLFMMVLGLSQITIILIAAYAGIEQARAGDAISFWFMALPSVVGIHFAIIGFFIALCVPMKFKWAPRSLPAAVPTEADPNQIRGGAEQERGSA